MKRIIVLLNALAALCCSKSFAGPTIEYFDQKLDPSNGLESRTFKQRFVVDSTFAKDASSPVIYYICGESNCFDKLNSPFPPLAQYEAMQLHANLVALEHRYFGKSQPFADMTSQSLKYLTISNAIADLALFQTQISEERRWTGKWISIGVSYAGALSAFYRLKHPELVVGALASSAPVEAQENFDHSDFFIAQKLGASCVADVHRVFQMVEAAADDPVKLSAVSSQFGVASVTDVGAFLQLLSSAAGFSVQFGVEKSFCSSIAAPDPIPSYAAFSNQAYAAFGVRPEDVVRGPVSTNVKDYDHGVGIRQWDYLQCSQLGFFTVAYPDPNWSVESARYSTLASAEHNCTELFGITKFAGIGKTNEQYFAALMQPNTSNIVFTNGSNDPWSLLSITRERGNDLNPKLTAYTIDGASHGSDISAYPNPNNSASLNEALALIHSRFTSWLK